MFSAEVNGLEEARAKMEQTAGDLTGDPMKTAMRKATLLVMRDARKDAPVDRGPLRASITPEVAVRDKTVEGIVGSNKVYAPFQELGTPPFTPPWTPIFEWAMRKLKGDRRAAGALTVGVRAAIRARGIKAKRFLQGAVEKNAEKIMNLLGNAVSFIVRK
jgi:HK97 gp10 family phage protein